MANPKIELRVVCAKHGTQGHAGHAWPKRDMAKAEQSVIDANHHAEMNPDTWYAGEAPYRIQSREVGKWADMEATDE